VRGGFDVTQQRIPFLLCSLLLAAASCGGGDGQPVHPVDPNAPPDTADQPPATGNQNPAGNQNPVNPISRPPDNSQPPNPPPTDPGPGNGGGPCVQVCEMLPARGCMTPPGGCEEGCADLMGEQCGPQLIALEACALPVACPENIDSMDVAQLQEIAMRCPRQYQDFMTCNGTD
jgi:hypothetical protein